MEIDGSELLRVKNKKRNKFKIKKIKKQIIKKHKK